MDITSSVFTLTVGIVKFILEHENKDNIASQIYNIIIVIQSVIKPLLKTKITDSSSSLRLAIEGMETNLKQVNDHLVAWNRGSRKVYAAVNPWAMTHVLKDDLDGLMRQYVLLVGALQTTQFMRGCKVWKPSNSTNRRNGNYYYKSDVMAKKGRRDLLDKAPNLPRQKLEVDTVWQMFLGKEADFCRVDNFISGIARYTRRRISSTGRKRLIVKLDEKGLGYVLRCSFKTLIGSEAVAEAIRYYTSDPQLPLLIWVDGGLHDNARKVDDARQYGVTVVQFADIMSAKSWMEVNKRFLKNNDNAKDIRYVTDQEFRGTDSEESKQEGIGSMARKLNSICQYRGEQVVEFIRLEMKLKAPIIVCASRKNISETKYVERFSEAGSLALNSNYARFREYVFQLSARLNETTSLKFDMPK